MASTPIEVPKLPEGLTLTADIYPRGSDTADQTGIVLTEETSRKGTYTGTVTGPATGKITLKVKAGGTVIAEITSDILDTIATFILEDLYFDHNPLTLVGPGGIVWDVCVTDNAGDPVPDVACWVTTDIAGNNVIAGTLYTDDAGNVQFMLDPETYYLWRNSARHRLTNPLTMTVPVP